MKSTLLFLLLSPLSLFAQCFDPGDGSDGGFHATTDTTIVGATYHFASFTIDTGVTVSVSGNNPLTIYCQGTALINGTLKVSGGNGGEGVTYTSAGLGGVGVAGGANGGDGSFSSADGPLDGFDGANTGGANTKGAGWSGGGGAGYALAGNSSGGTGGFAGASYGDNDLTGLTSGSGGGGGSGGYDCGAGGGGAGGGVLLFNTTTLSISASGSIVSNGGNGGSDGTGNCGGGGGGSGGTIFINAVDILNNGTVSAVGGIGGASALPGSPYYGIGGNGSAGRIRIDHTNTITGTGTIVPSIGGENSLLAPVTTNQQITICFGDDFTVGSNTYSASGTYQDNFTAASGCDSTVNTVLVVESPVVVSVTNNTSSLEATASTGTFQWINCANNTAISGETASTFAPSANGDYAVIVTVNNCSDTSACETISGLGIDSQTLVASSVFPNPTAGIFKIEFAAEQSASIHITDFSGRTIQTISEYVSGEQIDLSKEARGIYLVNIAVEDQIQTVKITKQ